MNQGLLYLCAPFTFYVLTRYPHLRPLFGPAGLVLSIVAYVLSSFATEIWQLIATQGVLGSIGTGLLFAPSTLYLDEWWLHRKGLAYGVMWSGKSLCGAIMPFAFSAGLEKLGARWTMRIWSGVVVSRSTNARKPKPHNDPPTNLLPQKIQLLLTAPLLPSLRPRRPPHHSHQHHHRRLCARPLDTSFLRQPAFWALQTGNVLQSLGYFLPTAYLPSYTRAALHHPPAYLGPLLLAACNATSVLGSFVLGVLNDRMRARNVIGLSAGGSAAAVLLCWGVGGRSVGAVALFGVLYGFFAGGFSSTWAGVLKEVGGEREGADTGFVFGLLAGGRGVGSVVSGPLSVVLLNGGKAAAKRGAAGGFGTEYGLMIVFTGVTAVLGGWGWFSRCSGQVVRSGARRIYG
jgi:MFS family permease